MTGVAATERAASGAGLAGAGLAGAAAAPDRARLRRGSLGVLVFSGFLAIVEPSPYELAFVAVAGLHALLGLRLPRALVPLLLTLLLFNLGGALSLLPFLDDPRAVWFVAISAYLMVTAVFYAAAVAGDAAGALGAVQRAWVPAAMIAATCGLLGYFDVAGLSAVFTKYDRAAGTFKDPNVLGPFLTMPTVHLMQGFLLGTHRRPLLAAGALGLLLAGVFFSFSRGAWAVTGGGLALMMVLTFLTSPSARLRGRVLRGAGLGVGGMALALAAVLAVPQVREMFAQRAALVQDYDGGETGRFASQRRSLPLLLDAPNGLGPLQFSRSATGGEDPHNVYLNAFASYGWLGGLAYLAFVAATLAVGWRAVWIAAPWQGAHVALWSVTFLTILQGVQIDTDHWRHFYLLAGASWGSAIASERWREARRREAERWGGPEGWRPARARAPVAS